MKYDLTIDARPQKLGTLVYKMQQLEKWMLKEEESIEPQEGITCLEVHQAGLEFHSLSFFTPEFNAELSGSF